MSLSSVVPLLFVKRHLPLLSKVLDGAGSEYYDCVQLPDGTRRALTQEERIRPGLLPSGSRIYRLDNLSSQSIGREKGEGAASWFPVTVEGREFRPNPRLRWKTNEEGMERLIEHRCNSK